jgi:hypothetical protein
MTLYEFLDNISWADLKQNGSDHYKGEGVEQVDLYRSIGQRTLATWALTGAQRRASRNLKALENGDNVSLVDVRKVIHELMFLYVELRDGRDRA